MDWTYGRGVYIGTGASTYEIVDENQHVFWTIFSNGQVGEGRYRRTLLGRDGKLVVMARMGADDVELPEVILDDGMTGWWERSGKQVFSRTRPDGLAPKSISPTKMASLTGVHSPAEMLVGVAAMPPRSVDTVKPLIDEEQEIPPGELPVAAARAVTRAFSRYRVARGTNGIVVLERQGRYYRPDELPDLFGEFLEPPHCYPLLRALRNNPATHQLTKLDVAPLPPGECMVEELTERRKPGWYRSRFDDATNDTYVCSGDDGFRLTIPHTLRSANVVVGKTTYGKRLLTVMGVVAVEGGVYPRARGGSDFDLLVHCPRGERRNVVVLVMAQVGDLPGEEMLALHYHLYHDGREIELASAEEARRKAPFFVTPGKDGNMRFFRTL